MNVVRQMADYRPRLEVVERRVADLDDGYTRLATMILEELAGADFTKRQFKVMLAVIRLTYGWNKSRDRIANSQLSEIAKLPIKRVSETRVQLIKMNVLTAAGQMIGINKNVSEWSIPQNGVISPKSGDEESLNLGDSSPSNQGDTIDIIPKTIKITTPNPLSGVDGGKRVKQTRKPRAKPIPYQKILDAYNEVLSDRLPFAEVLNDERKRGIKKIWGEMRHQTVEAFAAYFAKFSDTAKPFYFGDNDTGWKADFDYLLRPKTLTKTREGGL